MPVARRMTEAESVLLGRRPEPGLVETAAEALAEGILKTTGRRSSSEYKLPVVKNVFKRVLQRLC
jgi:CO/xanthine dehydrogenase FAD-binding subunit